MPQDKGVTAAFAAAVERVEKAADFSGLGQLRKSRLLRSTRALGAQGSCGCENDEDLPVSLPRVVPLLKVDPSECETQVVKQHLYRALPFSFAAWPVSGLQMSHLEVVECPIHAALFDSPASLSDWDESFRNIYYPFPVPFEASDFFDSAQAKSNLWRLRAYVLRQCIELWKVPGHVHFSVFKSPDNQEIKGDLKSYLEASNASIVLSPWEEHARRMVPAEVNECVYAFEMKTFVLTRKEVAHL